MLLSEQLLAQTLHLSTFEKLQLIQHLTTALVQELVYPFPPSTVIPLPDPPSGLQVLEKLTYQIIGCAMEIHRKKGPGYRENTYQRDLEVQRIM